MTRRVTAAFRSGPLAVRSFRLLAGGQFASTIGDFCYAITLPWLVLSNHTSTILLGIVLACCGIPRTVLIPVGGILAGKLGPGRVELAAAIGPASVAMGLVPGQDRPQMPLAVKGTSVCLALDASARSIHEGTMAHRCTAPTHCGSSTALTLRRPNFMYENENNGECNLRQHTAPGDLHRMRRVRPVRMADHPLTVPEAETMAARAAWPGREPARWPAGRVPSGAARVIAESCVAADRQRAHLRQVLTEYLPQVNRNALPEADAQGRERAGLASCASWMACCGNHAPAAGSSSPQSGSNSAWAAAAAGQVGWV
jgi:hypothetical protein